MAWFYLITASLFEVGWPLGLKLADMNRGWFGLFIGLSLVSMALSGLFLYLAQRTIPISTAYVVWTGIGSVCTFVIGVVFFGDAVSIQRLGFALLILVGVVGMEVCTG